MLRHDLRNKLASVRNASFYLRRRVEKDATNLAEDPRVPTFFRLTGTELDAAEAILAERIPRLPEVVIEDCDVDAAIAAAIAYAGAPVSVPPCGMIVRALPAELALAVACLIQNAIEAGATAIEVIATRDGGSAVIEVRDDGPGFAAELAPRAADAGVTTRDGHLGLGLAIVKRIAGRALGELRFANRFQLVVPCR